ncbi:hypothetical protein BJV78DRAFT_1191336, partial [Lactifluus subvellereus]
MPYVLPPPAPKPYTQENGKPDEKQKPEAPKTAGLADKCAMDMRQCCNELRHASDPQTANLLTTLGMEMQDSGTLVGVGCSPFSALGGEGKCTTTPLCCGKSYTNGVAVACQPLALT